MSMINEGSEVILSLIGRMHPVVLHLPIGLIVGLLALEILALGRRRPLPTEVRRLLALLLAMSALASAVTGLLLAEQGGYAGALIERHRNLGLATAVLALVAGAAALAPRSRRSLGTYGVALVLATIAIVPAGHFGGEITHGVGFLTEPLGRSASRQTPSAPSAADTANAVDHAAAFAFIDTYCAACHGATRSRGGLVLTSVEAMLTGGESGPALVPGDPHASELLRRLRLDLDHEDRMPPPPRRQPTEEQIGALERWVTALGSIDLSTVDDGRALPTDARAPADTADTAPVAFTIPETVRDGVRRLAEHRVHVEVIDPATGLLWVDFVAARQLSATEIAALLAPVASHVAELGLAGTAIDDDAMTTIGPMPALSRLDLSGTRCGVAALVSLETSPQLRTLVLHRVALGDDAVEAVARLPFLARLYVSGTGLDSAAVASLGGRLPECEIVWDEPIGDVVLEVEQIEEP